MDALKLSYVKHAEYMEAFKDIKGTGIIRKNLRNHLNFCNAASQIIQGLFSNCQV